MPARLLDSHAHASATKLEDLKVGTWIAAKDETYLVVDYHYKRVGSPRHRVTLQWFHQKQDTMEFLATFWFNNVTALRDVPGCEIIDVHIGPTSDQALCWTAFDLWDESLQCLASERANQKYANPLGLWLPQCATSSGKPWVMFSEEDFVADGNLKSSFFGARARKDVSHAAFYIDLYNTIKGEEATRVAAATASATAKAKSRAVAVLCPFSPPCALFSLTIFFQ